MMIVSLLLLLSLIKDLMLEEIKQDIREKQLFNDVMEE
jgi:hypothetical protein